MSFKIILPWFLYMYISISLCGTSNLFWDPFWILSEGPTGVQAIIEEGLKEVDGGEEIVEVQVVVTTC